MTLSRRVLVWILGALASCYQFAFARIKAILTSLALRKKTTYDVAKKDWNAEPGEFLLLVGASSDDIRLNGSFALAH